MTLSLSDKNQKRFALCLQEVARQQSRDAFGHLFSFYAPRLKQFFLRAGVPGAQADDLVQETMVQVWRKAGLYDPNRASVSTWIFRIGRNRMIDHLRKSARPDLNPDDPIFQPAADIEPETFVAEVQMVETVRQKITGLPADQQQILRAAFYEGHSHSQISRTLNLPLGTVKSRLRLAFQHLRGVLEEARG